MNQRKNIWIAKGNIERFEQEPNKSGLVNILLDRHYDPHKYLRQLSSSPKPLEVSRSNTEPQEPRRAEVDAAKGKISYHPNMALPTTLEEANDPNSPGYSANIKPDRKDYGALQKPGKGKAK